MHRLSLLLASALASSLVISAFGEQISQLTDRRGADVQSAGAQSTLPSVPAAWPSSSLQLGMASGPGDAPSMRATAPFGFRYQYLAGGANTGSGWSTWNPDGGFATSYIQESINNGMTPVFTYYMIRQSAPGNTQSNDGQAIAINIQNTSTMAAYYNDLKLLFQRTGAFPSTRVVVHMEPDLWGFLQQRSTGDNAATVAIQVGSTGVPELAGLPDNTAGFAQAAIRLRDRYAPNTLVAYHMSVWGTGNDIVYTNPPDATVDSLATRSGNFFLSLGAAFDVSFADWTDRDAAFKQFQYGDGGASWWDSGDFARNVRYLTRYVNVIQRRVVIWQIPYGNTKMRAENNTWNHYQDNHVEWILDDPGRTHLNQYLQAGVIGFLFGRGADGPTCACDANHDGVTNPNPINGNNLMSLNADDDGGFFRQKAAAYYTDGAMQLPFGSAATSPSPTGTALPPATSTPTRPPASASPTPALVTATATWTPAPPAATATRTPAPATSTPAPTGFSSTASTAPTSLAPGQSLAINASVTSGSATTVLVDVEVYSPANAKVFQQWWDNQAFAAGQQRTYSTSWQVPSGSANGTYVVSVGVFSPGWGTLYNWNGRAATFSVTTAPTATPTAAPAASPTTVSTTVPTATAAPTSGPITVTFDDLPGQNIALNGQYPSGVIDWGSGSWYLSGPWGRFTTKSLSFRNASISQATFTLITPRRLVSLQAYNGSSTSATVTLSCPGQPTVRATLAAGQLATIATNWTGVCSSVTIATTNTWWTNFDNLMLYPS